MCSASATVIGSWSHQTERRSSPSGIPRRQLADFDYSALDHGQEVRAIFQWPDVAEDVAVNHEQVRQFAFLERTDFTGAAHDLGPVLAAQSSASSGVKPTWFTKNEISSA